MHPRPPRIWTHKHARIVGRHSPHNNNKNPSARLRLAARHIMSSRSLGRDSVRRSHVITAARERLHKSLGRCGLLRRRVARSFRFSSPIPVATSIDLPSPSPIPRCLLDLPPLFLFLSLTPPHSSRTSTLPPSQECTYTHRGDSPDIPFVVGFDSLPACVQLANKLNPVVSFRLYIETRVCRKAWDPLYHFSRIDTTIFQAFSFEESSITSSILHTYTQVVTLLLIVDYTHPASRFAVNIELKFPAVSSRNI